MTLRPQLSPQPSTKCKCNDGGQTLTHEEDQIWPYINLHKHNTFYKPNPTTEPHIEMKTNPTSANRVRELTTMSQIRTPTLQTGKRFANPTPKTCGRDTIPSTRSQMCWPHLSRWCQRPRLRHVRPCDPQDQWDPRESTWSPPLHSRRPPIPREAMPADFTLGFTLGVYPTIYPRLEDSGSYLAYLTHGFYPGATRQHSHPCRKYRPQRQR
jgi:hypothetical protein